MVGPDLIQQRFCEQLQSHAIKGVEYSYDLLATGYGIMVGGPGTLFDVTREFARDLEFAADWWWATARIVEAVRPDTYLFRVDILEGRVVALTLYLRFPSEPTDSEFVEGLRTARPFGWIGPNTDKIARALRCPGPRGIGLRVDENRRLGTSLYFKAGDRSSFDEETARRLTHLCGFSETCASALLADLRSLYVGGPVGVIGLDSGDGDRAGALKFDPPNVPLSRVLSFAALHGSPSARLAEITAIAYCVRAQFVSYLGVKYGAAGFCGCRAYFSVNPSAVASASGLAVRYDNEPVPTLRLPHY